MDQELEKYLKNLKKYGEQNNIPNVTEKVGRFLNMLIKIRRPENILEIGCANGYSTIWMAEGARAVGAKIHTIDHSQPTFEQARKNLSEIGLADYAKFYFGDAVSLINSFPSDLRFDFVFVDGEKSSYLDFWQAVKPWLSDSAVIIFDDMMAFPAKTRKFSDFIQSEAGIQQILLPIDGDDGILMLISNFQ